MSLKRVSEKNPNRSCIMFGGKGAVPIMQNLWAQEVDADSHIKSYQDEICIKDPGHVRV